jgi:DNA segregation ATPase FtsK/SpoIIIE, S-DNA-T family
MDGAYQEIFSRGRLRELMMAYWRNEDPTPTRKKSADHEVWSSPVFRPPSERITISFEGNEGKTPPPDDVNGNALKAKPTKPKDPIPSSTSAPSSAAPSPAQEATKPAGGESVVVSQTAPYNAGTWAYPNFQTLLQQHNSPTTDSEAEIRWLRQTESACKAALQQFQLHSKLLLSSLTPNAALLKFQGSANLTVDQVLRRRSEFLTTHRLNVISVRAEPGAICIAVARPERRILQLADVWNDWKPSCTGGNHDLLVGIREENSEMLFLSPKRNAPHTLIAGSTGSGKSVLMQNLILGIAVTNRPQEAQIIVIDPKLGVDYFAFEGLPHLNGGIVDAQDRAIEILNGLVAEMDRRYTILRENRVSSVFDLNKKPSGTVKLPILWVIHDEFAEWMMTEDYKEQVSNIVSRLGVKARAAGIYLIFAAQRPDVTVMPPQLRANLGNRLILRVDGEGTSEIALGEKGAERLLGKGHMVAKLEGEPDLVYAQVPFVDPTFLANAVELIKKGTCSPGFCKPA